MATFTSDNIVSVRFGQRDRDSPKGHDIPMQIHSELLEIEQMGCFSLDS